MTDGIIRFRCPNCTNQVSNLLSESKQEDFIVSGRYYCNICQSLIKLECLR